MKDMTPNVRFIAFDYDGTLSNNRGRVSERTQAALRLAHRKGYKLALATGRSASSVPPQVYALPFDFIITANGARVLETKRGVILSSNSLSRESALAVFDALRGMDFSSNLFLDGQFVLSCGAMRHFHGSRQMTLFQKWTGFFHLLFHARFSCNIPQLVRRTQKPIEKIGCLFHSQAECQTALQKIRALDKVEVVTTNGRDLEITAKGINKGWALATLCKHLAISRDEVIAFGDSGNDFSMVEAVGCFLAPANATPDILEIASHVIPSVDEDGVAIALEALFNRIELHDMSTSSVPSLTE
jgi:hypothetical protein